MAELDFAYMDISSFALNAPTQQVIERSEFDAVLEQMALLQAKSPIDAHYHTNTESIDASAILDIGAVKLLEWCIDEDVVIEVTAQLTLAEVAGESASMPRMGLFAESDGPLVYADASNNGSPGNLSIYYMGKVKEAQKFVLFLFIDPDTQGDVVLERRF